MPLILHSLEQGLAHLRNNNMRRASFGQVAEGATASVRGKTLLVRAGRLDNDQLAALRDNYAWPVEVVDQAAMQDAIEERDPKAAILCPIQGLMPYILVYDAASRDLVYYQYISRNPELRPGHLKDMAKTLSKD
jgi:hypothetical protein